MKIDLHCHSKHSKRPSLWLMQKLGCPESYTDPIELYHLARQKGMTHVTITDHNVIDGALEIAGLPNTFTGCEYTTYFPEDRCKIHVLVYGFTEGQHFEMNQARENIYDFVDYLHTSRLHHVCAHPLFGVNDRLTLDHVEKLLLLFKNWEWNGDLYPGLNGALRRLLHGLDMAALERLVVKHRIVPRFGEPWKKNLVAGSDDHSSLSVASAWTEVANAHTLEEFWQCVEQGQAWFRCEEATPEGFGRKVYGTAYQLYKNRFGLERYINKDILLKFLDQSLLTRADSSEPWYTWLHLLVSRRRRAREMPAEGGALFDWARFEAEKLVREDPQLMAVVRDGAGTGQDLDEKWFEFVNQVSNRVLAHFGRHALDRLIRAQIFDVFHSLGSAGALYAMLAPYFVGFSVFSRQRAWAEEILTHGPGVKKDDPRRMRSVRVAHFTDTFDEVNGVARTLNQQLAIALKLDKQYSIYTCFSDERPFRRGVDQFTPVGVYDLPEYAELKLLFPPFLQMLKRCWEQGVTHIHLATPGPIGLAGLGIARILQLPVSGTYHTALPQYTKALTEDGYMEDLLWRYMVWFYEQMDSVYVPSRATAAELIEKGVSAHKVRVYPRGCDIERFHPHKRTPFFHDRYGLDGGLPNMLYVGRVSKEKNLPLLCQAYRGMLERGVKARLIVTGDGPYRREMEDALKDTPAFFTGYINGEELALLYAASDFLVFPSTTDTFGNVVLEAQASGIPVIVSDQGGPQENLVPGESGFIVPANDVSRLVEAMTFLTSATDRRQSMGRAARVYMEQRGFEQAFEKLFGMYISERQPPQDGRTELTGLLSKALAQSQAIAS